MVCGYVTNYVCDFETRPVRYLLQYHYENFLTTEKRAGLLRLCAWLVTEPLRKKGPEPWHLLRCRADLTRPPPEQGHLEYKYFFRINLLKNLLSGRILALCFHESSMDCKNNSTMGNEEFATERGIPFSGLPCSLSPARRSWDLDLSQSQVSGLLGLRLRPSAAPVALSFFIIIIIYSQLSCCLFPSARVVR